MKVEHISVQGVGAINEDAVLTHKPVFAVFDGATSLTQYTNAEGKTGGWLAAHIAKDIFLKSKTSLTHTLAVANEAIFNAMHDRGIDVYHKENLWCTAVAAVHLKADTFDWVRLCDCLAVVIFTDETYKILGTVLDHDTQWLMAWKNFSKTKDTTVWNAVPKEILEVRKQVNVTYGFLNGENEALSFVESGTESLKNVAHILLFSDGLLIPKKDPTIPTDIGMLVKIYLEGGLKAAQKMVRDIENMDPHCVLYPRVKKHDDLSAIAISF